MRFFTLLLMTLASSITQAQDNARGSNAIAQAFAQFLGGYYIVMCDESEPVGQYCGRAVGVILMIDTAQQLSLQAVAQPFQERLTNGDCTIKSISSEAICTSLDRFGRPVTKSVSIHKNSDETLTLTASSAIQSGATKSFTMTLKK